MAMSLPHGSASRASSPESIFRAESRESFPPRSPVFPSTGKFPSLKRGTRRGRESCWPFSSRMRFSPFSPAYQVEKTGENLRVGNFFMEWKARSRVPLDKWASDPPLPFWPSRMTPMSLPRASFSPPGGFSIRTRDARDARLWRLSRWGNRRGTRFSPSDASPGDGFSACLWSDGEFPQAGEAWGNGRPPGDGFGGAGDFFDAGRLLVRGTLLMRRMRHASRGSSLSSCIQNASGHA